MKALRPEPSGGRATSRWAALAAVLALTVALGGTAAAASPADCNPNAVGLIYPPTDCSALLSTNSVGLGGTLGIVGSGFEPSTAVSVQLHSSVINLGTLNSDATGLASGGVAIPDSVPLGAHELDLTGVNPDGEPRQLTASVQIDAAAVRSSGTGSGPGALFWTATGVIALALFGAILLLVLRRGRGGGAG